MDPAESHPADAHPAADGDSADDALEALAAYSRSMRERLTVTEGTGPRFAGHVTEDLIGRGASATVWRARPVDGGDPVAIKRLHLGAHADAVLECLEREQDLLAQLDHPNIAEALGWTTDESGARCIVMEYVDGRDIVTHCKEHDLPTSARLQLFAQACSALDHAHARGIVHRDVKPSNVLVTGGATPRVKVIDFGIAAAVDGNVLTRDLRTHHGAVLGTLGYMSPEQLAASHDVDARTDVYALGVLLFELLTDRLPIEISALGDAGLAALVRCLSHVPPARVAECVPAMERDRRLPRHQQIDAVAMRALEKQPHRRYGSAAALARDVQRYLDGEPVPGLGIGWSLRRFAHQQTWSLRISSLVLLLFGIAMIGRLSANPTADGTEPARGPGPDVVWEVNDLRPWARGRRFEGTRAVRDEVRISGEIGRLDAKEMILVVREVWHSSVHNEVFAPMKVYELRRLAEASPEGKPRLAFVAGRPILDAENHTFDYHGEVVLDGDRLVGEIGFRWRDYLGVVRESPLHRIELCLLPR